MRVFSRFLAGGMRLGLYRAAQRINEGTIAAELLFKLPAGRTGLTGRQRGWTIGLTALIIGWQTAAWAVDPQVSNVSAAQRAGTKLVDITYNLTDSDSTSLVVSVQVSTNNAVSYDLPASNFSGAGYGFCVTPGTSNQIAWNAGADWNGQSATTIWFKITANDGGIPSGFVLIPAGSFVMGATTNIGEESYPAETPQHPLEVSAFYMETKEVTKAQWDGVYAWATNHGYSFGNMGLGKASTHPVYQVTWYSAVKWCNARSEMEGPVEGLTPVYYTTPEQTTVYRTGDIDISSDCVNWSAKGYRLPTEAEWEKAARGGTAGYRFPWSTTNTITHSRANYKSNSNDIYDVSSTRDYHPNYATGAQPYTSPAGSFSTNGYGLYDMAGNVCEWCWDWYDASYYSTSPESDPRGPASGSTRVRRGGNWQDNAYRCRTAYRGNTTTYFKFYYLGFRCVRGL